MKKRVLESLSKLDVSSDVVTTLGAMASPALIEELVKARRPEKMVTFFDEQLEDARAEGGAREIVLMGIDTGATKEYIISRLMDRIGISEAAAQADYDQYSRLS